MKDWVLVIGIEKHYLTEKQAEFYLKAVESGVKLVKLDDGRIFGVNLQSLMHENAMKGEWKCAVGNWHRKEAECFCDGEWQLEDGKAKFVQKSIKII